ncbi:hypothetical protein EMIT0P258_100017 [Pseudomonas sp. IT-P258]
MTRNPALAGFFLPAKNTDRLPENDFLFMFLRTFTCYLINHRQLFSHTPECRAFYEIARYKTAYQHLTSLPA